ncbi:MAG: Rieske 2Fe-2S domain-containing protein, partial [Alphaproteobacteria bacterium]|nr:Rieske 2Fe-2S domain-containing protein [Alphaproteobacteria bacterium]
MVDLQSGQISREIFVNETIYQEELERVFARAWLFVGHESQIPHPGDFAVAGMGEESVILCRDRAGEVHVFLNSCRHRGMKVCRYDEGNTAVFTCPYHGWSYSTDGRLVGVPFFREAYHSQLDRSQWGLVEVA